MGAAAVLVNCLPAAPDPGVGTWLRPFTESAAGRLPEYGASTLIRVGLVDLRDSGPDL